MDCKEARERLTATCGGERTSPLEEHMERCSACARYAARIDAARRLLTEHHGNVEPDPAFAGRVIARLPNATADVLGWAAMKLLPVTIALALVLGWFALQTAPNFETEEPADDLLGWVIGQNGIES